MRVSVCRKHGVVEVVCVDKELVPVVLPRGRGGCY